MELIKEKEAYMDKLFNDSVRVSVEEDIIVPDVKPDILKVLQVDARAYITDKGIISGGVYVQGKLYVNILYIPDSETEEICSIKTEFGFKTKIDNSAVLPDMSLKMYCDVIKADFSAINSRKLAIMASVLIDYEIFSQKELELCVGIDEPKAEFISNSFVQDRISVVEDCEFQMRSTLEVPSGKKSISQILKIDARVDDKDIKVMPAKVITKGNVFVSILYLTADERVEYFDASIPFTEVFDVFDLEENDLCRLQLNIGEIKAELNSDSDGDMRVVNVECQVNASLAAINKKEIKIISDCICPGVKTSIDYDEAALRVRVGNINMNSQIKELIVPDSKIPTPIKIYNVVADAEITKINSGKGVVDFSGKLKVYLMYITDNSKCPVYSIRKEIPFDYSYECENADNSCLFDILTDTYRISYNINSNGEIDFRCFVDFNIDVYKRDNIKIMGSIKTEELKKSSDIVICFAGKGDTLWDIAKRYSVKQAEICELNGIDEKVCEGQKIIIPSV